MFFSISQEAASKRYQAEIEKSMDKRQDEGILKWSKKEIDNYFQGIGGISYTFTKLEN